MANISTLTAVVRVRIALVPDLDTLTRSERRSGRQETELVSERRRSKDERAAMQARWQPEDANCITVPIGRSGWLPLPQRQRSTLCVGGGFYNRAVLPTRTKSRRGVVN